MFSWRKNTHLLICCILITPELPLVKHDRRSNPRPAVTGVKAFTHASIHPSSTEVSAEKEEHKQLRNEQKNDPEVLWQRCIQSPNLVRMAKRYQLIRLMISIVKERARRREFPNAVLMSLLERLIIAEMCNGTQIILLKRYSNYTPQAVLKLYSSSGTQIILLQRYSNYTPPAVLKLYSSSGTQIILLQRYSNYTPPAVLKLYSSSGTQIILLQRYSNYTPPAVLKLYSSSGTQIILLQRYSNYTPPAVLKLYSSSGTQIILLQRYSNYTPPAVLKLYSSSGIQIILLQRYPNNTPPAVSK
ncbi:hypothetical protein CDAR_70251 [Caerostris darwini]|uniref:Uncharacterized protein n=1 Tax=Caerostris darwini TaxID=1538125 RepID=A0AAV4NE83_9ARAC|nr:hypothetical protein CDAR_70251 [Caerostris darwini]